MSGYKQDRLSEDHRAEIELAANVLAVGFAWGNTPEGFDYWESVQRRLWDIAEHGTSDGKPWIKPEPPKPEPFVPTDEWLLKFIAKYGRRPECIFRNSGTVATLGELAAVLDHGRRFFTSRGFEYRTCDLRSHEPRGVE